MTSHLSNNSKTTVHSWYHKQRTSHVASVHDRHDNASRIAIPSSRTIISAAYIIIVYYYLTTLSKNNFCFHYSFTDHDVKVTTTRTRRAWTRPNNLYINTCITCNYLECTELYICSYNKYNACLINELVNTISDTNYIRVITRIPNIIKQ